MSSEVPPRQSNVGSGGGDVRQRRSGQGRRMRVKNSRSKSSDDITPLTHHGPTLPRRLRWTPQLYDLYPIKTQSLDRINDTFDNNDKDTNSASLETLPHDPDSSQKGISSSVMNQESLPPLLVDPGDLAMIPECLGISFTEEYSSSCPSSLRTSPCSTLDRSWTPPSSRRSSSPTGSLDLGWRSMGGSLLMTHGCPADSNPLVSPHYRQLLQCVATPVGEPSCARHLTPDALCHRVAEIHDVDPQTHGMVLRDVQRQQTSQIRVTVTVVEARDLAANSDKVCDPYCMITMVTGSVTPTSRRRFSRTSLSPPVVMETGTIRGTRHPQWNEQLEFDLVDSRQAELHVSICDDTNKLDTDKGRDKRRKSLLRLLVDTARNEERLGFCKIPLRDIPGTGSEHWYDLFTDKKMKHRASGMCKLRVNQVSKQALDELDAPVDCESVLQAYVDILYEVYTHAIKERNNKETSRKTNEDENSLLGDQDKVIIEQLAIYNHVSPLTQKLVHMVLCLRLAVDKDLGHLITEDLVKSGILDLSEEIMTKNTRPSIGPGWATPGASPDLRAIDMTSLVSPLELELLHKAGTNYVEHVVQGLNRTHGLNALFPPSVINLDQLKASMRVVLTLLTLQLWPKQEKEEHTEGMTHLLVHKIQEDTRAWVRDRIEATREKVDVVEATEELCEVVEEATQYLQQSYPVQQYFSSLRISYYKLVTVALDSKLSMRAQQLLAEVDDYQVQFRRFAANIRHSSVAARRLYVALRGLSQAAGKHFPTREWFKLNSLHYQTWFSNVILFWLDTFRDECVARVNRALEIEKDIVQVTTNVKISNSAVDVLSSFSRIIYEWGQINYSDVDIVICGITIITELICDGGRKYAEKIHVILENNGYYDFIDNQIFDVTDELCITLNNIEHVKKYVGDLRRLLEWDRHTEALFDKHDDHIVSIQASQALQSMVDSATEDMLLCAGRLLSRITQKMAVDLRDLMDKFLRGSPYKPGSVDPLMQYLQASMDVLWNKLDPSLNPILQAKIWHACLDIFAGRLSSGRPAEYYHMMTKHFCAMKDYFSCLDPVVLECESYKELVEHLSLCSLSSEELMLLHGANITRIVKEESGIRSPVVGMSRKPLVVLAAAYSTEPGTDQTTLQVKVVGGRYLYDAQGGICSTFISVSVCPYTIVSNDKIHKTPVRHKNSNPEFNTLVQIGSIPSRHLQCSGAILVVSAWKHDRLLPSTLLGEAILPLWEMPQVASVAALHRLPVSMVPLNKPTPSNDKPFKVLVSRAPQDHVSKMLVKRRLANTGRLCGFYCAPVQQLVTKVKDTKLWAQAGFNGSCVDDYELSCF